MLGLSLFALRILRFLLYAGERSEARDPNLLSNIEDDEGRKEEEAKVSLSRGIARSARFALSPLKYASLANDEEFEFPSGYAEEYVRGVVCT